MQSMTVCGLTYLRNVCFNNSNYFCYYNYYCYCYSAMAVMALAQQVHTAQYVDTMSRNVSLALAAQEVVDGRREVGVGALEESGDACWD